MAKSLLKFIVKIVMTLLTHTVVKILMDKNIGHKFTNIFCLSNIACSRNKTITFVKSSKKYASQSKRRFILISAFYPHFSVLSPFQFPFSVSVSAIQFQRFIPIPILFL